MWALIAFGLLTFLVHTDCVPKTINEDPNQYKRFEVRKRSEGKLPDNDPSLSAKSRRRPQAPVSDDEVEEEEEAKPINIVKTLSDLLQSKALRQYTDKFAKKAAVVYRAIRDEFLVFIFTINCATCYILVEVKGGKEAKVDATISKNEFDKLASKLFSRQSSGGNMELARRQKEDGVVQPLIFAVDGGNGISAEYNGKEIYLSRTGTSLKTARLPAEAIIKAIKKLLKFNNFKHSPQKVSGLMSWAQGQIEQADMQSAYPGMRQFKI